MTEESATLDPVLVQPLEAKKTEPDAKPVKKSPVPEAKKPELTKSANEPLSIKANAEARAKAYATNRWATIKHIDEANDPTNTRDEVIVISIMESGPPEVAEALTDEDNEVGEHYTYQQVGPGVAIGMRRGGEFGSVDGFGWKDKEEMAAHTSPVDVKPRVS